jgi:hypothetical protein
MGYRILPSIDREKYQNREAERLEGPYILGSGKVVYYDLPAGRYYDPDTDLYISDEEYFMHEKNCSKELS